MVSKSRIGRQKAASQGTSSITGGTKPKKVQTSKAPTRRTKAAASNDSLTSPLPEEVSRQGIRLAFLIHDVSRLRRAAYDQIMKPLNITRARWWVLAHLSRHDGMMQSQLADVLGVGKASLGIVIEQLEAAGWVERRADPQDKRARRVYMSRTMQPLMKRMIAEEDRFNERLFAKFTPQDRADLLRLLSMVKDATSELLTEQPGSRLEED